MQNGFRKTEGQIKLGHDGVNLGFCSRRSFPGSPQSFLPGCDRRRPTSLLDQYFVVVLGFANIFLVDEEVLIDFSEIRYYKSETIGGHLQPAHKAGVRFLLTISVTRPWVFDPTGHQ